MNERAHHGFREIERVPAASLRSGRRLRAGRVCPASSIASYRAFSKDLRGGSRGFPRTAHGRAPLVGKRHGKHDKSAAEKAPTGRSPNCPDRLDSSVLRPNRARRPRRSDVARRSPTFSPRAAGYTLFAKPPKTFFAKAANKGLRHIQRAGLHPDDSRPLLRPLNPRKVGREWRKAPARPPPPRRSPLRASDVRTSMAPPAATVSGDSACDRRAGRLAAPPAP